MSTIYETMYTLEEFNKWRRGNKRTTAPDPFEVGVAIGDAVRLLRELFVMQVRAEKAESELAAAKAERDLAITRLASILWSGAIDNQLCGDVQQWADDYTAERDQLRAENDEMRVQIEAHKRKGGGCQCADDEACAHVRRAERAEAEVERLLIIEKQFKQSRQETKEDSK